MIKTLTSHGNSAALVIDKAILELPGISMSTPLKITTDGKSLIVMGKEGLIFLTLTEVIEIHKDQVERYGGHTGLRDYDLLCSAAAMSESSFCGNYLHIDIFEMVIKGQVLPAVLFFLRLIPFCDPSFFVRLACSRDFLEHIFRTPPVR